MIHERLAPGTVVQAAGRRAHQRTTEDCLASLFDLTETPQSLEVRSGAGCSLFAEVIEAPIGWASDLPLCDRDGLVIYHSATAEAAGSEAAGESEPPAVDLDLIVAG